MKLRALLLRAAHHGVAQVLGTILFLAGAAFGVSLIVSPDTFLEHYILAVNFEWMLPQVWGGLFLATAIFLLVTVWVDTDHAQLPALVMGVLYILFGSLILVTAVNALVYPFIALGWVSIFVQVVCWARGKRETILHSHEPQ